MTHKNTGIDKTHDQKKREQDLENLFEAEVEYVLDEIQKKTHELFGERTGSVSDCAMEIGSRLAGAMAGSTNRKYWLHDMGVIVLHVMALMEAHGYKLSEEVLEIMAQLREERQAECAARKKRLAS